MKLPKEYVVEVSSQPTEVVAFCDATLVPSDRPSSWTFVSTSEAIMQDFIQLMLLYPEQFDGYTKFALLCIGSADLKKEDNEDENRISPVSDLIQISMSWW